jgi:hypothetical protein
MTLNKFTVCLFLLAVNYACVRAEAISYPADWDSVPAGAVFTQMTSQALDDLGGDLFSMNSPSDSKKFCPNFESFDREQRKQFYVMLISSIARYESSFDPATTYKEPFLDVHGSPVISRGLMQLSIESANGYGCGIKSAKDLHDPEINLRCSVRILTRWVTSDACLACQNSSHRGIGRYWSVIRKGHKQNQIAAKTKALPDCQ